MSENRQLNTGELLAVLEWYRAAGVDLAVGDEPVDRFATSAAAPLRARPALPQAAPAPSQPTLPGAMPGSAGGEQADAHALAAKAQSLEELREIVDAYDGCSLKHRATQLVFADGNPQAEIMLIGEAPGAEEDLQGKPFVGRAGQLLDRMLGAIGLDRTKVYIVNTVPWRPPGNRNPSPQELQQCMPFLVRQVELVAPKIIVTLGAVATQNLFGTTTGILRARGQWRELTVGSHTAPAIATLHPAYLLRQPSQKGLAWRDLLTLKVKISSL